MINISKESNLTSSRKDSKPKPTESRYIKIKYVKTHTFKKIYQRDPFQLKKYAFWAGAKYREVC